MPADPALKRSLKSKMRVAMNPNMAIDRRHGCVWFDVSGFGRQRRDFTVDHPDALILTPQRFAKDIALQIMLIDPTLPKREQICNPTLLDVEFGGKRRVLDLVTMQLKLEQ